MAVCLEREPVASVPRQPIVDDDALAFAQQCQNKLGYCAVFKELYDKPGMADAVVRRALTELNMAPLKQETVDRYKEEKKPAAPSFSMMAYSIPDWSMYFWTKTLLKEYKQPVPRFALQTALDVTEKLTLHGEVQWYVESLTRVPDPFLVLRFRVNKHCDWHDYYLEVWNESEFTLEREI